MLASNGEITPPCGVPASVSLTVPSSITPASSHWRINFNTLRSEIRSFTSSINVFPIDAVKVALNVRIHDEAVAPVARLADRFQRLCRTPLRSEIHNCIGWKSASKIGSITNFAAIWITRSRTVGILMRSGGRDLPVGRARRAARNDRLTRAETLDFPAWAADDVNRRVIVSSLS